MTGLRECLEPEAQQESPTGQPGDVLRSEVEASIAISLKRIADALDGTTVGVDVAYSLSGLTHQLCKNQWGDY